jgi:hypothetical protein
MTATGKTFKWMLWSPHGHNSGASDEFVVVAEGFRVRLMGDTLELSFEASGTCSPNSARALAEKYVEALRKCLGKPCSLMTEEDWSKRMTPPFGGIRTISTNREDQGRVASAAREARNELLASEDEALRRCYDSLQDARERMRLLDEKGAHVAVYEAMEVLETHFKSKKERVAALGNFHKEAMTAANTKRHILEKVKLHPTSSVGPIELATEALRRYERHLLVEERKKKEGRP